jgi:hypothetical protein
MMGFVPNPMPASLSQSDVGIKDMIFLSRMDLTKKRDKTGLYRKSIHYIYLFELGCKSSTQDEGWKYI